MKFFSIILISSYLFLSWAYLDDVQDTLEPSHQLYYLYSRRHNLQTKSDVPNTSFPAVETLAEGALKSDLSSSLPRYLHSTMADILHAYGYDLCSLLPSVYEHFHYHIFESGYHDIYASNPLSVYDNDIWSPKQYDSLNYLLYENFVDKLPYYKTKTFIETKVTAMKLQVFNL